MKTRVCFLLIAALAAMGSPLPGAEPAGPGWKRSVSLPLTPATDKNQPPAAPAAQPQADGGGVAAAAWSADDGEAKGPRSRRSLIILTAAKMRGRDTRHGAEGAGEGAVVGEAAFVGDVGDGAIGFAEEAGGGGDAGFGNELRRRDAEDAPDDAGESRGGQARDARERGGCERVGEGGFETAQCGGDLGGDFFRRHRRAHVF